MFIELTTDSIPATINIRAIAAVRPLTAEEKTGCNGAYKAIVVFRDRSSQFVDQPYGVVKNQLPQAVNYEGIPNQDKIVLDTKDLG